MPSWRSCARWITTSRRWWSTTRPSPTIPASPSAPARGPDGLVVTRGELVENRTAVRPVDIVHAHNTFPLLSPRSTGPPTDRGAAVVQTIHNYRPMCPAATLFRDGRPCEDCVGRTVPWPAVLHACYRGSGSRPFRSRPGGLPSRRPGWRDVDAFIALTDFAAGSSAEGGLPADRIHVKHNFISPGPWWREGSREGFLFVGRLSPEKGSDGHRRRAALEPGIVDPGRRGRTGGRPSPRAPPSRHSVHPAVGPARIRGSRTGAGALLGPSSSPRSGTRACR